MIAINKVLLNYGPYLNIFIVHIAYDIQYIYVVIFIALYFVNDSK